tara:strand:- start:3976 stop:4380 length:405 start_codon:yes stop_codon:yes gene_type:complete
MAKDNLNNRLADLEKSRELTYGSFSSNMKKIAKVWSIILDDELSDGIPLARQIPAHKVALMYAAAKIVRASNNYKEDSYDDALAYLVQAEEMHRPEKFLNTEKIIKDEASLEPTEEWIAGYKTWKKDQDKRKSK